MAVLNMRYDGDEILRKKCKEVKEVDDRIREILNDMTDTLHATPNGAAIAANQVGILKRLVVIDMGTGLMKLVNPVIVEQTGEQDCIEGCLSFPEKYGRTIRPQTVIVKALDENGEEVSREVINNSTYQTSDVTVKVGTKSDNAEATKLVEEAIETQDQEKINAEIRKESAIK